MYESGNCKKHRNPSCSRKSHIKESSHTTKWCLNFTNEFEISSKSISYVFTSQPGLQKHERKKKIVSIAWKNGLNQNKNLGLTKTEEHSLKSSSRKLDNKHLAKEESKILSCYFYNTRSTEGFGNERCTRPLEKKERPRLTHDSAVCVAVSGEGGDGGEEEDEEEEEATGRRRVRRDLRGVLGADQVLDFGQQRRCCWRARDAMAIAATKEGEVTRRKRRRHALTFSASVIRTNGTEAAHRDHCFFSRVGMIAVRAKWIRIGFYEVDQVKCESKELDEGVQMPSLLAVIQMIGVVTMLLKSLLKFPRCVHHALRLPSMTGESVIVEVTTNSSTEPLLLSRASYVRSLSYADDEFRSFRSRLKWMCIV
ncbi:hypothetical protein C4D60_Mb02t04290 [Musa balbisiana]|uniref:Uncharacterized protein n=1 Tax=Musa balbisiana TaxID=52838 RepID=A0A4S8I858_MUSBA|nr:hypothetical protein C4D60_Mb02t04290 [Musa balbisiana]